MRRDAVRSPAVSDARNCGDRMKSWHGWRPRCPPRKEWVFTVEFLANCLEVCRELGTLAAVFSAPDTDGKGAIWPACTKNCLCPRPEVRIASEVEIKEMVGRFNGETGAAAFGNPGRCAATDLA
jgi:hypothetical protein